MNRNWICRSDPRFLHSHDPSTTHSWFIHQIIFLLFPLLSLSFQFCFLSLLVATFSFITTPIAIFCWKLVVVTSCCFIMIMMIVTIPSLSCFYPHQPISIPSHFFPHSLFIFMPLSLSFSLILFLHSLFWLLLVSMIRPLIVSKKKGKRWWWSGS